MARSAAPRRLSLLLGAVAALVFSWTATPLAHAADPAGTVVLVSGDSAYPPDASLEAVSGGRLVFQGSDGRLTTITASTGDAEVLATGVRFRSALGDRVLYLDPADFTVHWVRLSTGATGQAPIPWKAASAGGGYYLDLVSGTTHLYDQSASTAAVTDLGSVAARDLTRAIVLSNADGAAIIDTDNAVGYFVDATTRVVTTLSISAIPAHDRAGLRCASISGNAIGCAGAYGSVLRVPLDGSAALVAATGVHDDPQAPHAATDAYVSDTGTAWLDHTQATDTTELYTRRVSDGVTTHRTVQGDLLTTPSAVYFRLGTATPDAAIYSAASAASTPSKYARLPPAPLIAHGIALGPGRVSWRDDSTAASPLFSRSLSSAGGALTASPRSLVATGATGPVLAVSGLRTAYVTGAGAGSDRTLTVTDGTTSTPIAHVDITSPVGGPRGSVALSGSRVAYRHRVGNGPAAYQVLDLRTGHTVDTTATLGAAPQSAVALWGNYYVYSKTDGSVWRKDLSTTASGLLVSPGFDSADQQYSFNDVYEWGDLVAYTITLNEDIGLESRSYVRNVRTLDPATQIGDSGLGAGRVTGASAGGVEFSDDDLNGGPYRLIGWDGASSLALPTSSERDAPYSDAYSFAKRTEFPPAIDGSTVGWVGTDDLPRVAPLGRAVVNRPRALGLAIASSTLPVGGSWRLELPTSAALTSCQVSLTDTSRAVIRTLPCDDSAAAQGEVVATWDGRDAGGRAVEPGVYTWEVTAGGVDGLLLDTDGSTAAVNGHVVVRPPALFHPSVPSRLLDTRVKLGGARPAGRGTVALQVTGRGGVPADGVAAVALNVTVVHPASAGFVSAYANGSGRPNASNLNFHAGQTVSNLVTAPVGPDGRVDLYNGSDGATDLVADVAGYYATTPLGTPGALVSTAPSRLLDTRIALGAPTVAASRGTVALDVTGHGPVPASGVSAVLLTVTATGSSAAGYLTVYGGGTNRPAASNLNFLAGNTVPNLVVAPVGRDGRVNIYNGSSGTTQIVADVAGYYLAGSPTRSGAFVPTPATRLLDTRSSPSGRQPGPHATVVLQVTGRGAVPTSGAGAVVLNVTAVGSTAAGYVTVFPHGSTRPTTSNLNVVEGRTVSNLVDARVGAGGQVDLYNGSTGSSALIVDVFGYFLS